MTCRARRGLIALGHVRFLTGRVLSQFEQRFWNPLGSDRGRMTAPTTPGTFLESLPRLGSDRLQASSHSGFVDSSKRGNFLGFPSPSVACSS